MQAQYDADVDAFRCFYTGLVMVERDDRRAPEWEHRTPGVRDDVVLATKLVNAMKTDLTEPEFKSMVVALAARFDGREFDGAAFPS